MVRTKAAFLLFFILVIQQTSNAESLWQPVNDGISDLDIRTISVFPGDNNFVCAASLKSVYFSENAGRFWKTVFSLESKQDTINFVTFDYSRPNRMYLATSRGLLATNNQGESWQRLFRKVSEAAKKVNWIALDSLDAEKIYIGTDEGLYLSCDSGASWRKISGGLPRSPVRAVEIHPANSQVLYLANTYGLFKSIDGARSWERTYLTSHKLSDEENDNEEESGQEQNLINCIAIDKANPRKIFIATGEGVFASYNAGASWKELPSHGLSSDYVNFIVCANKKGNLYAATNGGVFKFLSDLNKWHNIYQGMTARQVRSLALNTDERQLFAGTDRGVFRTMETKFVQKQKKKEKVKNDEKNQIGFEQVLKELSQSEPTIREVQEAALRYAEVIHPERIKTLRRNAKVKALLPDVSVDYDKTVGSSYGNSYVGPYDWGLTLKWDVGDLVFNEQVRLIDSNTRLMVQLRDDILDEVTRLYYERRKLQTELILNPAKTSEVKLARILRLEELTANIDALTGGYFSERLKE